MLPPGSELLAVWARPTILVVVIVFMDVWCFSCYFYRFSKALDSKALQLE